MLGTGIFFGLRRELIVGVGAGAKMRKKRSWSLLKKGFDRKLSFFNEGPKKMKEEAEEYEITSS